MRQAVVLGAVLVSGALVVAWTSTLQRTRAVHAIVAHAAGGTAELATTTTLVEPEDRAATPVLARERERVAVEQRRARPRVPVDRELDEHGALRNGVHTTRHSNGGIDEQGEFVDGLREGLWTSYAESATKILEGRYEHGDATGTWHGGYDAGTPRVETECDAGQRHGRSTFWNRDGKVDETRSGVYVDGELVSRNE